jgi:GNAT superfamily N-acetyltransferase
MGFGGHSSASACFLGAETNEDSTEAIAAHVRAQGSDLATVMAGAGTLYWNNLVQESNNKQGYSYVNKGNFGGHAALAGAMGIGDCSHASAELVRAGTSDQHSFALAVDPRARGNGLATVLGAAGALISAYDSTDNSRYLGAQGAFVGALGLGGHASASADFVGAGTYGYSQSTAYACDLRAKGSSFAAVAGGAGAVEFEQSPIINDFDYQGSAVGAYSNGPNSKAFARYIRADTSWDESSAFARCIGSGLNGEVFAGVAHPLIGGVDGITVPAGYYSQATAGITSNPTILYWGVIP